LRCCTGSGRFPTGCASLRRQRPNSGQADSPDAISNALTTAPVTVPQVSACSEWSVIVVSPVFGGRHALPNTLVRAAPFFIVVPSHASPRLQLDGPVLQLHAALRNEVHAKAGPFRRHRHTRAARH
jgi:hypothetical protein